MNYLLKISFFALVLTFVFSACETFEDGGLVNKADDRILNTWELNGYFRNGIDETSLIFIKNYEESYLDDGVYTRSYITEDNQNIDESGTWEFESDEIIHVDGVSSINEFSSANSTLSSSTHKIIRLKKEELWYVYENGGDMHEFHFRRIN